MPHKVQFKRFLVYRHYYEIQCTKCGSINPALEYAEAIGTHPFQTGKIKPSFPINVWLPFLTPEPTPSSADKVLNEELNGKQRIESYLQKPHIITKAIDETGKALKVDNKIQTPQNIDSTPIAKWSKIALHYHERSKEGGDFHHRELIAPHVLGLLETIPKHSRIVDVGCGEGYLSRIMFEKGRNVVGIDPSDMIDFAISYAEVKGYDIDYIKLDAAGALEKFGSNSFDVAIANMVLMDIDDDNIDLTIGSISQMLTEKGIFIFSILHPAFTPPALKPFRLPWDSDKNSDKIYLVGDYINNQNIEISLVSGFPTNHFHRPLSYYASLLKEHGFVIEEMIEPKPTPEQVLTYPREMFMDYDRMPIFLVVKALKLRQA